jgi:hypothetical protein
MKNEFIANIACYFAFIDCWGSHLIPWETSFEAGYDAQAIDVHSMAI